MTLIPNSDSDAGLLPGVTYRQSPNCNLRPVGTEINLIVIHGISVPAGQFGGGQVERLFLNQLDCSEQPQLATLQGLEVSAHLLIDRSGQITQFVPFDRRAWHAGKSVWDGSEACNDYSIGIELEGADHLAYTPDQYHQLTEVVSELMRRYPQITPGRVVGHCEVAPGRKTDPGPAFNWPGLRRRLERARLSSGSSF